MQPSIDLADGLTGIRNTEISCYFNEVPSFAEPELERLYNTLHSSLPFFRIFRTIDNVNTYTARCGERLTVILLFQIRGGTVHVLNEMIDLEQEEIERFAAYVFGKFPQVDIISFKAIRTAMERFSYPVQKHNAKETFVISLPATSEQYNASLNRNLREQIPYKLRKLARRHPSFSSRFYEKDDIPEQVLKDLIRLSEERISKKMSDFTHDEQRIIALAKRCGFVNVLEIDGQVCAGTINYSIGTNIFLELLARDPTYSTYSIGTLTMYLSACEGIRRKKKNYYLGGGRFEYKEKLLGILVDADQVEIYRSQFSMFIRLENTAKTLIGAYVRRAKVWVHMNKNHPVSSLVTNLFLYYRRLRS